MTYKPVYDKHQTRDDPDYSRPKHSKFAKKPFFMLGVKLRLTKPSNFFGG